MGGRGGKLLGGVRDAASRLGLGRSSYNYDAYNQGPYRRQCAATRALLLALTPRGPSSSPWPNPKP